MAYITPNDAGILADSDSRSIMNAIAAASSPESESRTIRIPRRNARTGEDLWEISETILLPSDMTVILDDCHLRMADGVMCNMFRNENMYKEGSLTPEGEQSDIHILGYGDAVLDGGNHNGLDEITMKQPGMPHVRSNNLILLHNVSRYSLEGFRCVNLRYWAINQLFCRNGYLAHLDFQAGKHYRNQDGINLRIGCSDILIEHITGYTGDDVVALTALPKGSDRTLAVEGRAPDIHDVTIRCVRANTCQSIVALRNHDGAKLYRIQIENITDSGARYYPWGVVRLGENNYFRERESVLGETYEITVRGVYSLVRGTVFLGASLLDSHISDVHAGGGSMHAVSTFYAAYTDKETGCARIGGVTMKNVVIDNIFYNAVPAFCHESSMTYPGEEYHGCALDFRCMRAGIDRLENVVVRDVFTNGAPKLLIDPAYAQALKLPQE